MAGGTELQKSKVYWINFSLVEDRPEQDVRMWGMSSTVAAHSGDSRQKPSLFLDQCLQRLSLLKRPETILAWMVAWAIFAGDDTQVDHRG